jgi:5-methylcytosine-specific restriction protein A
VLTREGWCAKHKPREQRKASAGYHGWYMLPIWTERLRPAQLLREPFCRECARQYPPSDPRHRTPATVVDHIIPHCGEWDVFIDPDDLQSLCKRHHDIKTAQEQRDKRRF